MFIQVHFANYEYAQLTTVYQKLNQKCNYLPCGTIAEAISSSSSVLRNLLLLRLLGKELSTVSQKPFPFVTSQMGMMWKHTTSLQASSWVQCPLACATDGRLNYCLPVHAISASCYFWDCKALVVTYVWHSVLILTLTMMLNPNPNSSLPKFNSLLSVHSLPLQFHEHPPTTLSGAVCKQTQQVSAVSD